MAKVNQFLGKWSKKKYEAPSFDGIMQHTKGEWLMQFGCDVSRNNKAYRLFYGIGTVYRVIHGKNMDMLKINFGAFPNHPLRTVLVIDNHSRRQLLTLKRGYTCQVFGFSRIYIKKEERNGKTYYEKKLALYAKGINAWYVPKMLEIKKMPENLDLEKPTQEDIDIEKELEETLEDFLTGDKEE